MRVVSEAGRVARHALGVAALGVMVGAAHGQDRGVASEEPADPGWQLERYAMRLGVFQQDGAGGFQSQASPRTDGRGSEFAWIIQPLFYARIRQDARVRHDVYVPLDVVTSASTDALDAVSTASRENEAGSLDVFSTVDVDADTRFTLHWGTHFEETLRSAILGVAVSHDLADHNAVLTLSADSILDILDPVQFNGFDPGLDLRFTGSLNASISQLLSPTTIVSLSYGVTLQTGTLATTWNSVALDAGSRLNDAFPSSRLRHALTARLTQAIPDTQTFLAVQYRTYADDFGIVAITPEAWVTQYFGPVSLRVSYRFHAQTAPHFWASRIPVDFDLARYRTGDSDLEALGAHEVGLTARWYYDESGARTASSSYVEATVHRYERSNGLFVNVASIGWGVALR